MRSLIKDPHAQNFMMQAIIVAIAMAIGVIVIWNVMGSMSTSDIDTDISDNVYSNASSLNIRPAYNSSLNVENNIETLFTVMPIIIIVLAAISILSYILILRRG